MLKNIDLQFFFLGFRNRNYCILDIAKAKFTLILTEP